MRKKRNIKVLLVCLAVVYAVAFIGSFLTSGTTDSEWYDSVRPSITPPNWVFPVVWNVLFFLIALSLYFAWTNSKKNEKKKIALVFGINFALNILWTVFYFGMKNPLFAFYEIFFLEASIAAMIYVAYKIEKKSAYLLVPYLLWVGFAIVLNYLSIK
jgi:benzodiazapine receptor